MQSHDLPKTLALLGHSQHTPRTTGAALYLRTDIPTDELFDAAEYRLGALIDLLAALQLQAEDSNLHQAARALLLLASDARSLYQAARI